VGAGGITATAQVIAETSDLKQGVGENIGAVTVPVVPDASDFWTSRSGTCR
jgi:hypothetical protein